MKLHPFAIKLLLLILLAFALITNQTAASTSSGLCLRVADALKGLTSESRYSPAGILSAAKSDDLRNFEYESLKKLSGFGIKVKPNGVRSIVNEKIAHQLAPDVIADSQGTKYYGRVFDLESTGATGRAHWSTPALLHPEFASELRRLRASGENVVFDPTMEFVNVGGWHRYETGVIGIGPNTTWAEFVHEAQHVDFHRIVHPVFGDLKVIFEKRKGLTGSFSQQEIEEIGIRKLKKIESLYRKGIQSENTINEVLSVDAQLRAMGWARFSVRGTEARLYALAHQITDLEKLGTNRTTQQTKLLKQTKLQYEILNLDSRKARAFTVSAAAGSTAIGYGAYDYLTSDRGSFDAYFSKYRDIFYDNAGHIIGVRPDGSTDFLLRKSN